MFISWCLKQASSFFTVLASVQILRYCKTPHEAQRCTSLEHYTFNGCWTKTLLTESLQGLNFFFFLHQLVSRCDVFVLLLYLHICTSSLWMFLSYTDGILNIPLSTFVQLCKRCFDVHWHFFSFVSPPKAFLKGNLFFLVLMVLGVGRLPMRHSSLARWSVTDSRWSLVSWSAGSSGFSWFSWISRCSITAIFDDAIHAWQTWWPQRRSD